MVRISDIDSFQAGTDAADFGIHVAAAARNFTCGVFKNYTGSFIPNAADDFLQGLWSGFCQNSPTGLPTPPAQQFVGGQCPIPYNITLDYTFTSGGVSTPVHEVPQVYGPIVSVGPTEDNDAGGFHYCWYIQAHDGFGNPKLYHQSRGGGGTYTISGFSYTVATADGSPDSCGNPPPAYPVVVIPPGFNVGPFNITLPGGGTPITVDGTITVPGGLINITPQLNITAQNPSLIGAVNLSVDLGGIHLTPGDSTGASVADIQALLNKFGNNIVKTPAAPPTTATHTAIAPTGSPGNSGQGTGLTNLDYVTINLTTIPSTARVQFGNGTSPNVLIGAGWIEFSGEAIYFPRESINFASAQFKAPDGADGYAYTLSNGFLGNATSYQRKQTT